jgi:hypothetical protein
VLTDAQGQWVFPQAPRVGDDITFFVTHPDFARLRATVPLDTPKTTNAVTVLSRGVSLVGVVVSSNNAPVVDASVEEIDRYGGPGVSARTDASGYFYFPHVNPEPIKLAIEASGFAPLRRTVLASAEAQEHRFVRGG